MNQVQITDDMKGHLERLRESELQAVQSWLHPGMKVLELGGGSGYQAQLLANLGCDVISIDVPNSRPKIFFPVQEYDGTHIPADDATFDVVFSSNVLEHIHPLSPILAEIHRVLKPNGLSIHIMPSSVWRFWSSCAAYPFVIKSALGIKSAFPLLGEATAPAKAVSRFGVVRTLKRAMGLPLSAHAEYLNAVSEMYLFSRRRWLRTFRSAGFEIVSLKGNELLYTGYGILPWLDLQRRRKMAKILGSACHIFVTRSNSVPP